MENRPAKIKTEKTTVSTSELHSLDSSGPRSGSVGAEVVIEEVAQVGIALQAESPGHDSVFNDGKFLLVMSKFSMKLSVTITRVITTKT